MSEIMGSTQRVSSVLRAGGDAVMNELVPKLVRFQKLVRNHGGDVEIDSKASREAWLMLPEEVKMAVLKGFSGYLDNCEDLVGAGISLRDNYALVMHSVKKAGLYTIENVKSILTDDHIVEVYNLDHVQLFRSINFFDLCNYSLLDLLSRQWFELFERLESVTNANLDEITDVVKGGKLRRMTVGPHLLKELDSNPRGVFNFNLLYCCPVFSAPGVPGGYLLIDDVKELDLFAPKDDSFVFLR